MRVLVILCWNFQLYFTLSLQSVGKMRSHLQLSSIRVTVKAYDEPIPTL